MYGRNNRVYVRHSHCKGVEKQASQSQSGARRMRCWRVQERENTHTKKGRHMTGFLFCQGLRFRNLWKHPSVRGISTWTSVKSHGENVPTYHGNSNTGHKSSCLVSPLFLSLSPSLTHIHWHYHTHTLNGVGVQGHLAGHFQLNKQS